MNGDSDFEIGGRLKARRLQASYPPKATTLDERVRTERTERRRRAGEELQSGQIYEELEIEKHLDARIGSD
jgi:hypothetical protein